MLLFAIVSATIHVMSDQTNSGWIDDFVPDDLVPMAAISRGKRLEVVKETTFANGKILRFCRWVPSPATLERISPMATSILQMYEDAFAHVRSTHVFDRPERCCWLGGCGRKTFGRSRANYRSRCFPASTNATPRCRSRSSLINSGF